MFCKASPVAGGLLWSQVQILAGLFKVVSCHLLPANHKKWEYRCFFGQRATGSGQRLSLIPNGFTLLELMVAIVLFSMISTAAYKLFMSVTRAQEATQLVLDDMDKLQRAEIILEKDVLQITRRPVRDEQGLQQAAVKAPGPGRTLMEFTRSGWQNPLKAARSTLQRVSYAVEDHQLIRYYWPTLDRVPESTRIRQVVLSGVNSVKVRFRNDHKEWISSWPPKQNLQSAANVGRVDQVPTAVELTIVHETMGTMVTLVPLITYKPDQGNKEGEPSQENRNNAPGNIRPHPRGRSGDSVDGY
ncbi:type II secretion system minor pseudopilin GspJ [Salinisphaera sp. G21_0]|uniref:type II secretion system minor pseudopilin GspJ n=1 Tax=Salinisphaera sp. G21_0 TaxID=2821094 RepID=UPI001ADCE427|nr:type II secretion system minor pseudopilin GspJ [Salinisphaera sp. G21_0]MBO9482389.1 type II secretion system minor pseudopilin GspJ [Salinisphaera sp. G21_0]